MFPIFKNWEVTCCKRKNIIIYNRCRKEWVYSSLINIAAHKMSL